MYCQYCGFALHDQAAFCPQCGKQVIRNEVEDKSIYASPDNILGGKSVAFNRDILVLYLSHLRTLEFSIQKLSTDLRYLDTQISRLGHPAQKYTPYHASPSIGDNLYIVGLGIVVAIVCSFIYGIIPVALFNWGIIGGVILTIGAVIAILLDISHTEEINRKNDENAERDYATAVQREQDENAEKARLIEIRPTYVNGLEKAQYLCKKAYSMDIIPAQFRNIYAIYYLYDYLSTSQSSLESAMLHLDLNEIKQKLNQIIEQQQQIILQQAQILANNDTMIQQTDELIQQAIKTEQNTRYAALYAEVAAVNLETATFANTVIAEIMASPTK